ncbi:right-handed parallel beta-helix repeat-containing protein [Sphingomonas solaris]|uniref:Right-handed parallel beta-helix repeat-containing protein n=1 Tax=Alterirhizorhabdus solaris TaxID=2529389 RepID=A0A558R688_9SPHN|nr:right-handed parallel beta-helix repeat-containing protein [Sphingomonas solaris]TVV74887.1 right-handed parallel beta-helix repeat-containing protein [Sphingomonas solaris]
MKIILALLAATTLTGPVLAQGRPAPFTIEATGKGFYRLDDAVRSIGDGDAVIRIASGTYRDCAVQEGGRIAYRAIEPGKAVFDGTTCEGKAALVLRGRDAVVDGLVFQNMRVPDGNGAGIRLEKGPLLVRNAVFRNSEEGILTADDPASAITIDRSSFSGLGRCDRGLSCAHSVYVNAYGSLTVTRSRFERGQGGHYLKSRARRIAVSDSSFDDTRGHTSNYMIDLSTGATGTIAGNTFVQGADKENHSAFITVAPEGRDAPSAGLAVVGNKASLAPGITWPTVFVADWSHEPLTLSANQLGKGIKPFETR